MRWKYKFNEEKKQREKKRNRVFLRLSVKRGKRMKRIKNWCRTALHTEESDNWKKNIFFVVFFK